MILFDEGKLVIPRDHTQLRIMLTMFLHALWDTKKMTKEELEEAVELACMTTEQLKDRNIQEVSGIITDVVDRLGEEDAAEFLRSMLGIDGGDWRE